MQISAPWNTAYASYEEALAATGSSGYQQQQLVSVVCEKTRVLQEYLNQGGSLDLSALRPLVGILLARQGSPADVPLNVIDFGGAAGAHYFSARRVLSPEFKLRWTVIETEAMADAASSLWPGHEELRFATLDSFVEGQTKANPLQLDLVLTSSALQYTPNPLRTLRTLLNLRAQSLFITRTPFSDLETTVITVQKSRLADNGPGPLPRRFTDCDMLYPITFLSKSALLKEVGNHGSWKLQFEIREDPPSQFIQGKALNQYFGIFLVNAGL